MDSEHITDDDENTFISRADAKRLIRQAIDANLLRLSRAPRPFKLFGLNRSSEYAHAVASHLGKALTPHVEKAFGDGETYVKPSSDRIGSVRGHNVFVIQSLYTDDEESAADKFFTLCMMCGALRDASAHEITVIIPHLAWARQDRKTESRAPITTKYIA